MTLNPTMELYERFDISSRLDLTPRYNIAPTQDVPVIVHKGLNLLEMMRWGLIPYWANADKIPTRMFNARAETITEKVSFNPTTLLNEVSRAGAFSCAKDRLGADAVACLPRTVAPHPHGRL